MCIAEQKKLEFYTKNADIIVSALGVPDFLKGDMVKDGVIIVDVGITRVKDSFKEKRICDKRGCRLRFDI